MDWISILIRNTHLDVRSYNRRVHNYHPSIHRKITCWNQTQCSVQSASGLGIHSPSIANFIDRQSPHDSSDKVGLAQNDRHILTCTHTDLGHCILIFPTIATHDVSGHTDRPQTRSMHSLHSHCPSSLRVSGPHNRHDSSGQWVWPQTQSPRRALTLTLVIASFIFLTIAT